MKKDDKKVTKVKSREIREKTNSEELKDRKRYNTEEGKGSFKSLHWEREIYYALPERSYFIFLLLNCW